jgi:hypothetical protein
MKNYRVKFKIIFITIIFFGVFGMAKSSQAATIYVDNTLPGNCSGNYSIASRNCSGSSGNAYTTIQAAITAMNPGGVIYMRGGTYTERGITIPMAKNGSAWTSGNFNTISSYPGEWAVIDGTNSGSCAAGQESPQIIGRYDGGGDTSGYYDLKYWLFEKFEVKNGGCSDDGRALGIFVNGGPNKFRYLYIHDVSGTSVDNMYALGGKHWQDSVVEYCWFSNNYHVGGPSENMSDIAIYSDYAWDYTSTNGFTVRTDPLAAYRNTVRYNIFSGSGSIAFKHKGQQEFTGRSTTSGFSDTYKTWGDKIHHNIVLDRESFSLMCHMDFCQLYNNIISTSSSNTAGIGLGYEVDYNPLYKAMAYNNTIVGSTVGVTFEGDDDVFSGQLNGLYGYAYNNILDSITGTDKAEILGGTYGYTPPNHIADVSNWYVTKNYSYRPISANTFRFRATTYNASGFQSQTHTASPRVHYSAAYNAGNLLYQGTTGADKYRIRSGHVVGGTTAGTGGVGGSHPYLAGITLPSYLGAANPNDDAWVAGVLGLTTISNLQNGGADDPNWIEGGGAPDTTPPAAPSGLSVL